MLPGLVRREKIDLVHLHSGSGGVFLLSKPRCPVVVTAHHTYLQEADLVFKSSPLKRLWKTCMSLLERRTYRLADKVTCVSGDTADSLVQRYSIDSAKITVIENGVDSPSVLSAEAKDPSTIVFVGRIEPRKGASVLLCAMREIHAELPSVRLRLIGRNMMGSGLRKQIATLGLSSVVTCTGYLHDPMVFREIARAALIVVPSLLEGFGIVAAQAMLLGTCVVASDAPGLRSVVRDGQTGLLFRSGDPSDCARVIRFILSDPGRRAALTEQALNDARKRFSFEARARELHDVFIQAMRQRKS